MAIQESTPLPSYSRRLAEVALLFLRLGVTAFGGPAAHIGIMRHEVVERRKWVGEQQFLDLFGAANLIPGPTSTEMAIFLGYQRVGWMGLVLGGVCFILPAMLIVLALAWSYVHFGNTPAVTGIFYGILPMVIAIVVQALWGLGRRAVKGWLTAVIGLAVLAGYFLKVNVLLLLLAGGVIAALVENSTRLRRMPVGIIAAFLSPLKDLIAPVSFSLPLLFLGFVKIGATLYGGGYVLLAYLRADFVQGLGWLTDKQLIDAIAIGQVTPGPLFTTATFVGYLLGGVPGALVATLGIFLPSFVFVAVGSLLIPRIRNSPWTAGFLDGVNVASLALMLGVTVQLASTAIVDPLTVLIALVGLFLLFRYKLNSTWLIAGGALIGLIHSFF